MSVALREADELQKNQARTVQKAMEARGRGDLKGFQEQMRKTQKIATVDLPACLRKAIESYPGNTEPYLELAKLEAAPLYDNPTGDRSRVERLLDEAKRLRPHDPTPWVMLAEMLSSQITAAQSKGRTELIPPLAEAALREIEPAIERYPAHPRMRLIHARLLERLARPEEAIEEYRKALLLAEQTSEKELKFKPEAVKEIQQSIQRLTTPAK
jgi:tetratricopeptide (TPR) repeat protein